MTLKAFKRRETESEPQTLGEHIQGRRLELGLTRKHAGARLCATTVTVLKWEKQQTQAPIEAMPRILAFLGYAPLPEPRNLKERFFDGCEPRALTSGPAGPAWRRSTGFCA